MSYVKPGLRAEQPKEMVTGSYQRDTGTGDGSPGLHSDTHPCNLQGYCPAHSFDMFLMVLCSFMARSQSLPLNSSVTTLRTVPSSRQWGAIPGASGTERGVPSVGKTRECVRQALTSKHHYPTRELPQRQLVRMTCGPLITNIALVGLHHQRPGLGSSPPT